MTGTDILGHLYDWRAGRREAIQPLIQKHLRELRYIASSLMRDERATHTLEPLALVNELFLRLAATERPPALTGRSAFLAFATGTMRRILIDHARSHRRDMRIGSQKRVDLQALEQARPVARAPSTEAPGRAIKRLGRASPRLYEEIQIPGE